MKLLSNMLNLNQIYKVKEGHEAETLLEEKLGYKVKIK